MEAKSKSTPGRTEVMKKKRNIKNIYGDIRGIYGSYTEHIREKSAYTGIYGHIRVHLLEHIRAYTCISAHIRGILGKHIRGYTEHIRYVLGNTMECHMLYTMFTKKFNKNSK